MVFPLFDDNSDRRRFPFVNYTFIVLNVLVFVFLQKMGVDEQGERFTYAFSTVPAEILSGRDLEETVDVINPVTKESVGIIKLEHTPFSVYLTLLTSMFMHGGWAHLLGNLLFLWIFGDNVEDFLGHIRYIIFYLVCGVLASLAHVGSSYFLGQNLLIPSLGASGAISGVLGGYILLYPTKRVTVILLRILMEVPAYVAIGIWFLFQLINSMGALGDQTGGGIAYGAHIGGFMAGLILVKFFAIGQDEPGWRAKLDRQPPQRIRRTPWA
jgi:membrane associated rhomboid family serine protease